MSFSPDGNTGGGSSFSGQMSFSPDGGQQQGGGAGAGFASAGQAASSGSMTSFAPGGFGMGGMMNSMGGMGMPMDYVGMMGGMGMMGGGMGIGTGGNEAMFRMALQSGMGQFHAQLMLLLPADAVRQALVPRGHLQEIAQRCQIRMDLGQEIPPNLLQVNLSGTVAANSMAAYFLQERLAQLGATK